MKVMIDTNIFISAILFPNGQASKALIKALTPPFQPIVCNYILEELRRKFQDKFPDKTNMLEDFLSQSLSVIRVAETPAKEIKDEILVRDVKDRPIIRAAINSNVDLLLTGDKDFLDSLVEAPQIISVAEFLNNSYQ